jgi:hypothetical protein
MPKLVLARGNITNTDELVIILSSPTTNRPRYLSAGLQRHL